MPKVHQVSEAEVKESKMLDYYVVVRREDNKEFIAGYRFEGYSGNAMWDEVCFFLFNFIEKLCVDIFCCRI